MEGSMEQATTSVKVVSVSREPDGVALIHLNRPPANSYDRGFIDDLNAAIDEVRFDESIGAAVLTSDLPKFFSAGADIGMFRTVTAKARAMTIFDMHEVTLGLLPGNGGTQRLPRLIGRQKAMELLLTGKPLDPKAAAGLGIVDRLLPADRLLPEAVAFASTMAGGPTVAIGEIKLAAKQGLEMPLESALALERGGIFRLFQTADANEGLSAFAEKRKPTWKGE